MLSVREALSRSLDTVLEPKGEEVHLVDALSRVLLEDVKAGTPLPPWDNSAMDGFALRAADTLEAGEAGGHDCDTAGTPTGKGPWLDVVDTIPAGSLPSRTINPGEAARIMTGAPMPPGADAVVMQEQTTFSDQRVQIHGAAKTGQHVRRQGEDITAGQTVLRRGAVLNATSLGIAAAVGRERVLVARRPTVGIIATGDELQRPPAKLQPGQIYSSNTTALMGLVLEAGGQPLDCGIARDNLNSTKAAFKRAAQCDLILSTGGVSVGDFDVVRQAMSDEGAEMAFWKIAMKPGKPLALGLIAGTPTFGLPGNPVSAQVGFLQFVRPWIRMALGDPEPFLPVVVAELTEPYRKKAGRAEFVRVTLTAGTSGWFATPLSRQGSGSQSSMPRAQGLMMVPASETQLEKGTSVSIQRLRPGLRGQAEAGYPWT